MSRIAIEVNGRMIEHEVTPRTHLGDFLRDEVRLTGTHLGCEHGVCGACTVLLDGEPVRSCITFAVACDGTRVTTVEGYDADPVMQRLRTAFTKHHALQCGFCTPGMLATARDIVLRVPDADERRIRVELAGNLCRCTGYMGIVAAVMAVLDELRKQPVAEIEALREATRQGKAAAVAAPAGPLARFDAVSAAPAVPATTKAATKAAMPVVSPVVTPVSAAGPGVAAASEPATGAPGGKGSRIDGHFDVPFPASRVWAFMGDLPAVAACLPGASIESHEGERVKGRVAVKFGPMSAAFNGSARLERDDTALEAVLRGAGQDTLSQSRATGDVRYRLKPTSDHGTRVEVELVYSLQGPLAQFSRSGLVRDFVRRMITDFGANVTRQLQGSGEPDAAPVPAAGFSPVQTMLQVLWVRLRRFFGAAR
jgi:aerobic carbon-monoxide dehydrogenase small subunit